MRRRASFPLCPLSYSSKNIVDFSENLNRDLCNLKPLFQGNIFSLHLINTRANGGRISVKPKKIYDKHLHPPTFVYDDSTIEIFEKGKHSGVHLISILVGKSMLDLCVLRYLVL